MYDEAMYCIDDRPSAHIICNKQNKNISRQLRCDLID